MVFIVVAAFVAVSLYAALRVARGINNLLLRQTSARPVSVSAPQRGINLRVTRREIELARQRAASRSAPAGFPE